MLVIWLGNELIDRLTGDIVPISQPKTRDHEPRRGFHAADRAIAKLFLRARRSQESLLADQNQLKSASTASQFGDPKIGPPKANPIKNRSANGSLFEDLRFLSNSSGGPLEMENLELVHFESDFDFWLAH